jgi:hypothetical protein
LPARHLPPQDVIHELLKLAVLLLRTGVKERQYIRFKPDGKFENRVLAVELASLAGRKIIFVLHRFAAPQGWGFTDPVIFRRLRLY